MSKVVLPLIASSLLVGCARTTPMALHPEHPANPDAAEAPLPQASQTLAIKEAVAPPASNEEAGVRHDAQHMRQSAAPTQPGATTAPAAHPAARQLGQPLFMCPMHPEVTSSDPNNRCPKCKMKINKPVKQQAPTAATQPTPSPAEGAGHEGHGGQH